MEKIAIVSLRYGLDVNGGSEQYARMIVEKLRGIYDVEVLTSRAIDARSWSNHYPGGDDVVNGVKVRRFSVDRERTELFAKVHEQYLQNDSDDIERQWVENVGPHCDALISYLKEHEKEYRAVVFVTYEYYLAIRGIPAVRDKAVFIPTAHDCLYIKRRLFMRLFNMPRAFVYLTEEERTLCAGLFHNQHIPYIVQGVGVEIPPQVNAATFCQQHGLGRYIIYVGRIEGGKNCQELFDYFIRYKRERGGDLKLVLMGKSSMDVPQRADVLNLGFVSDEEKFSGMAGAEFLIMPSRFESLSMVVLEAMASRTPVIVSGSCAVLRGHCLKSGGGLYYESYDDFARILDFTKKHPHIYARLADNAYRYIQDNYQWDKIVNGFRKMIDNL